MLHIRTRSSLIRSYYAVYIHRPAPQVLAQAWLPPWERPGCQGRFHARLAQTVGRQQDPIGSALLWRRRDKCSFTHIHIQHWLITYQHQVIQIQMIRFVLTDIFKKTLQNGYNSHESTTQHKDCYYGWLWWGITLVNGRAHPFQFITPFTEVSVNNYKHCYEHSMQPDVGDGH